MVLCQVRGFSLNSNTLSLWQSVFCLQGLPPALADCPLPCAIARQTTQSDLAMERPSSRTPSMRQPSRSYSQQSWSGEPPSKVVRVLLLVEKVPVGEEQQQEVSGKKQGAWQHGLNRAAP